MKITRHESSRRVSKTRSLYLTCKSKVVGRVEKQDYGPTIII